MATTYSVHGIPMKVVRNFFYEVEGGLRSTLDKPPHDGRGVKAVELQSESGRYSFITDIPGFTELEVWS